MKKILLSLGVVLTSFAFNAQYLTNLGFESAMTNVPGFVNVQQTAGWNYIINGNKDQSTKTEGTQSVKLVTAKDNALNSALQWGDSIITGIVQQVYKGAVPSPQNMVVSFDYKNTVVNTDSSYVEVVIWDTLAAGSSDDKSLYFGTLIAGTSHANWTPVTLAMQADQTGTANRITFLAVSSIRGYFDLRQPFVGTSLWLDNIQIGFAGIEENEANTLKVFPNPANEVLNVSIDGTIETVSVISMDGKVVSTSLVNNSSASVNVADLKAGVYFYEVKTANGATVRNTFVKQ